MHGLLIGTSALLAVRTETPEVAITPEEGTAFLNAATNVMRHYPIETTQKTIDWVAFIGVSAQVFGTRALAVMVKQSRGGERAPQRPAPRVVRQEDNVTHIQTVPPSDYIPSVPPGPVDIDEG